MVTFKLQGLQKITTKILGLNFLVDITVSFYKSISQAMVLNLNLFF